MIKKKCNQILISYILSFLFTLRLYFRKFVKLLARGSCIRYMTVININIMVDVHICQASNKSLVCVQINGSVAV